MAFEPRLGARLTETDRKVRAFEIGRITKRAPGEKLAFTSRQASCVYREMRLIKETAAAAKQEPSDAVAIISYDEKPSIQAIATTAPDLPPEPGRHLSIASQALAEIHIAPSLEDCAQ